MTAVCSDRLRSPFSLTQKLRSRSPLRTPGFWKWAAIAIACAFAFDAARNLSPVFAADAKTTSVHKSGDDAKSKEAEEEEHGAGHEDPVAPVLVAIVLILLLAKGSGDFFERFGMPAVLGELTVGILLGNLGLIGIDTFDHLFKLPDFKSAEFIHAFEADPSHVAYTPSIILKILAGIGVILLLFEVGLESTVKQMVSVGTSSLLVAVLGVIAPIILGWGVAYLMLPVRDASTDWQIHAFVGATLCATSVGITARVLKDLGRSQQRESQIILGAAVIDDVLGLIVLAVVSGIIEHEAVDPVSILTIVAKAVGFLAASVFLGTTLITRPLFRTASFLRGHGLLVATALVVCFGFSWLADKFGLATIVGAFAAGLILEKAHYRELGAKEHHNLEEALAPLTALLVPIFFVQMGTQVNLGSFADSSVWLLAGAITLMAILGKQVCALGVIEKGSNRLAVGLGMIPRGEVGLIFAGIGRELKINDDPVFHDDLFSGIVVMVMITTMVTPPLLKWAMLRGEPKPEPTVD